MKAVGVKQLKARLSEYVRLVKGGETILVTEGDEVVAELCPARRQRRPGEDLEEILQGLAEAGEITRPSTPIRDRSEGSKEHLLTNGGIRIPGEWCYPSREVADSMDRGATGQEQFREL